MEWLDWSIAYRCAVVKSSGLAPVYRRWVVGGLRHRVGAVVDSGTGARETIGDIRWRARALDPIGLALLALHFL